MRLVLDAKFPSRALGYIRRVVLFCSREQEGCFASRKRQAERKIAKRSLNCEFYWKRAPRS